MTLDQTPGRASDSRTFDRINLPSAFWSGVQAVGLTRAQVVAQSRLPSSAMEDSRVMVSTDQLFDVWEAIASLHSELDVGIRLVCKMDIGQAHPVLLAAMQARTFRDALACMARFKKLCSGEELCVNESAGEVTIEPRWPFARGPAPLALVDATFASIMALGRHGTGVHLRAKRIALLCSKAATHSQSVYFGAAVQHGAARNALTLGSSDLDLPFVSRNAELAEILMPQLHRQLAQRGTDARTSHRVKLIVKQRLSGSRFDVGSVANDLGTSVRTLQRRITSEGTTFRRIVDEARQELVRQYLADPEIGIAEAAFLLGYQDSNSFYRAFRAWAGTTPAHWREGQGAANARARSRIHRV